MTEEISEIIHYDCPNCGAEVELPSSLFSTKCAFCDAPVVQSEKNHDHQIDILLPFLVDKKEASQALQRYLSSKYFLPKELKTKTKPDEIDGIFIPFWVYQAKARSQYSVRVGIYWYETETITTTDSEGNTKTETRQKQHTEWFPHSGSHVKQYDDHLVCASKAITEKESNSIEPFDCGLALQFKRDLVAGWLAENPILDKELALSTAHEEIQEQEYEEIRYFLTGDTNSNLTYKTQIEVEKENIQSALLPIWIAVYHHKGESIRLLVNGQTGKVNGPVPTDWVKITLLILFISGVSLGIIFLFEMQGKI
jgi:hypothetical protein